MTAMRTIMDDTDDILKEDQMEERFNPCGFANACEGCRHCNPDDDICGVCEGCTGCYGQTNEFCKNCPGCPGCLKENA